MQKNIIHVVGAVLKNEQGEILCALRSPSMSMPNLWEFPGGKIEDGEKPRESLAREIQEELGCEIEVGEMIEDIHYEYASVIVHLMTYYAKLLRGTPEAKEHARIEWMPVSKLSSLEWAPADIPTIHKLV